MLQAKVPRKVTVRISGWGTYTEKKDQFGDSKGD